MMAKITASQGVPLATFEDKYGDIRTVHRKPNGRIAVKRETKTTILAFNQEIGQLIGARIKAKRTEQGLTLKELGVKAGITDGDVKNRVWEIENCIRGQAMRMGTLVAFAWALGCEPGDLFPPVDEIMAACGVSAKPVCMLEGSL